VKVTCGAILNIYIAAYRNKEEAIVSGNYKRTREQENEDSTVYE
jgi:hypothetical protein